MVMRWIQSRFSNIGVKSVAEKLSNQFWNEAGTNDDVVVASLSASDSISIFLLDFGQDRRWRESSSVYLTLVDQEKIQKRAG